jgi:hypothetical protein
LSTEMKESFPYFLSGKLVRRALSIWHTSKTNFPAYLASQIVTTMETAVYKGRGCVTVTDSQC